MNYYFNITLLPDTEMSIGLLMNALCAKLHKVLCDLKSTSIGVSFPKYQVTLGNILRVHGSESDLKKLQLGEWLGGMNGYCKIGEILTVPKNTKYRIVCRKQSTMSQAKLKRLLKHGTITKDKLKNYKAKMLSEKSLALPYIDLISNSNNRRHRRYIELGEILDKPIEGPFDQFGLSKTATIPWF